MVPDGKAIYIGLYNACSGDGNPLMESRILLVIELTDLSI